MGSQEAMSRPSEKPQHQVIIEQRFAIGRYPVTFDEYDHFCQLEYKGKPKAEGWGRGRTPVINVSWIDVQAYIAWLSKETSRTYRLPSEAEWEFACRAWTTTPFFFGDELTPQQANFSRAGINQTGKVGTYPTKSVGCPRHAWHVWEYVADEWHENYQGAPVDGSAWRKGGAIASQSNWYFAAVPGVRLAMVAVGLSWAHGLPRPRRHWVSGGTNSWLNLVLFIPLGSMSKPWSKLRHTGPQVRLIAGPGTGSGRL